MDKYERVAFEVTKSDGTLNGTEGKICYKLNDVLYLHKWSGRYGYKIPALGIPTDFYNLRESSIYELFLKDFMAANVLISRIAEIQYKIDSMIKEFNVGDL